MAHESSKIKIVQSKWSNQKGTPFQKSFPSQTGLELVLLFLQET